MQACSLCCRERSSVATRQVSLTARKVEHRGEWVREVFVAEVNPKQNEYGCVVLIVDGSKTHITP